jgi:hypothetical protein
LPIARDDAARALYNIGWSNPMPDTPNPERRSDAAMLCLSVGMGMAILAWVLGVGGVIAAVLSGGDPAALAGGIAAMILLPVLAVCGVILATIGTIWMIARVIADSREANANERYKDVER